MKSLIIISFIKLIYKIIESKGGDNMFISLLGLIANSVSDAALCFLYLWDEPECPKSLIK